MSLSNKRRSRRLRKKLFVGEFIELGFEFEADLAAPLTPEAEGELIGRFLAEVIEPRSLDLGGWITSGFIAHGARGSASDDDRAAIHAWLATQPEISEVRIGPLMDAWNAPEYGKPLQQDASQ